MPFGLKTIVVMSQRMTKSIFKEETSEMLEVNISDIIVKFN